MRRWTTTLWPAALGAAWLASLFSPLLSPGRALANRDIAIFHLPLRAAFRDLAAVGLPVWNPWLHGGQPILSNPSYGAFYPPSWLVFLAPPVYALSLMAVLHAAIAFAGAWRLARHFGCGRGVAALAAVGYVGSGSFLSLLSAYTLLGGMAWFPWVLAWGDESLRMPPGQRWWRPALLAGGALGLQLLNGEPSTVVTSGLALLVLAAAAAGRRRAAAPRVLLPLAFAVALAAVQLLPTLGRLPASPRQGLSFRTAATWSMPPARLVEIVLPRFFGDPTRDVEGLYFGWNVNDRDRPYIESLYPGLLLAVLGVTALLFGHVPRRAAWALAFAAGCFLAFGRHNPLYRGLWEALPVLTVLRYPEKFVLLAVFALAMAGALGWQRLMEERAAGRPEAAAWPLAAALVTLAAALTWTAVLFWAPETTAASLAAHSNPGLPAASRGSALAYLRSESWAVVRTALAVTLLLVLCRWRLPPRRLLEVLAILLLAADLWQHGQASVQTIPVTAYRVPPPLAAALLPARDRIYVQDPLPGVPQILRRQGDLRTVHTRNHLADLDPFSGLLWHIPYAFDTDFDMMLTGWGRNANRILRQEAARPQSVYRYLGAWNVGTLLLRRTFREEEAALRDPAALPLRKVANPYVLARFRFVPQVTFHADHTSALAAARAQGWQVARAEHWVRPDRAPETVSRPRPRLLEGMDEGGRIQVRYHARQGAFFVAAMTYDRGWQASVDGELLPTFPTAAGQLGVVLPPGEHRLVLRYREPLAGAGAAVSLLALAAGAWALLGLGRRPMA